MENNKSGFYSLGIAPKILETLDRLKFVTPTPIQAKCIPLGLEGKDLMGIAQTGTGKTLAFGIPLIQHLAQTSYKGLVILPTRELALQVEEAILKVGRSVGIKTAVLIGGAPMGRQITMLRNNPHVIIGTPGRLNDHLEQRALNLARVKILVLDEADRMLDMGFAPQIEKVIKNVPRERQTMLFSATMPEAIIKLANSYMKLPIRVEIEKPGTAAAKVKQEVFFVKRENKIKLLQKLLQEYKGSVLVFSRTKHGARKISDALKKSGVNSAEIHSNKTLPQRRAALDGFKSGKYRVLVATDIAARGIDVKGIQLVINYDLPENPEDYVHRIGRTGRAGLEGNAISFATPDQTADLKSIERLIRSTLQVSKHAEYSAEAEQTTHRGTRSRGGGSSRGPRDRNRSSRPQKFSDRKFQVGGRRRELKKKTFIDFTGSGSWTKDK